MSDGDSQGDDVDPSRIVADADVLAGALLVDGAAREVLGVIRRHEWLALVASDDLLSDTRDVIAALADENLAAAWDEQIRTERVAVSHPPDDHPGLASAYRGNAAHLLSYDAELTSAATNRAVQPHLTLSIRPPDALARLFDPASLYESLHDEPYPGPSDTAE